MKLTSRIVITSLVSLLLALYAATVYFAISTDYRLTVTSAERQAAALSSALGQHASRTMGEAESVLDTTSHYLLEHDLFAPDAEIEHFMEHGKAILQQSPQVKAVFLVNAEGKMVANSFRPPLTAVYVGDREYFRYHTAHKDQKSHISAPVLS
jgi:hypothetical protein